MATRKWERDELIKRIAFQGGAKWLQLQAAWRARCFRYPDREPTPYVPVRIRAVLCWWCREVHSPDEVDACMALPRRSAATTGTGLSTSSATAGQLLSQYSEVLAFLMATTFEDGMKRQTGRLSLSCAQGQWQLSAVDQETGQFATLAGSTPDECLLTLELGLAEGNVPWRASKYPSQGKKK